MIAMDEKKFDQGFLEIMENLSESEGVPVELLIETWCIRMVAEYMAEVRVYNEERNPLPSIVSEDGEPLRGEDLYHFLHLRKTHELENEFARELKTKVEDGEPLTEHERFTLSRVYGAKYLTPEDVEWTSDVNL